MVSAVPRVMVVPGVKKASFKWRDGYVIVYERSGELVIEAANTRIILSPREIVVEGLFQGVREYPEGLRGEKKVVYVDFAFPVRGKEEPQDIVFKRHVDTYIGGYGVAYTNLDQVGHYLTIFPPPGSLWENAVLSEDSLAILMLGRRQVYVMEEGEARRLILV